MASAITYQVPNVVLQRGPDTAPLSVFGKTRTASIYVRTTIAIAGIPTPGCLVEIGVIAYR